MKIRYSNTIEDLIALTRHRNTHSMPHRVLLVFARWVLPGVMLVMMLPFLLTEWMPGLLLMPLLIALMLLLGWGYHWLDGLLVRLRFREGKNKGFVGPHELELMPPDLIERTPVSETRHWLGAIEKVATTDTHAFIYVSSFSAHVIPPAGVTNGNYEAFVEAVRQEAENAEWVRSREPTFGSEAESRPVTPPSEGDQHVSPKQE